MRPRFAAKRSMVAVRSRRSADWLASATKNGYFLLSLCVVLMTWTIDGFGQQKKQSTDKTFPAWTRNTGSRTVPKNKRNRAVNSFGAKSDGVANATVAIQKAID